MAWGGGHGEGCSTVEMDCMEPSVSVTESTTPVKPAARSLDRGRADFGDHGAVDKRVGQLQQL